MSPSHALEIDNWNVIDRLRPALTAVAEETLARVDTPIAYDVIIRPIGTAVDASVRAQLYSPVVNQLKELNWNDYEPKIA